MIFNRYTILVGLLVTICSAYPVVIEMNEFYHPDLNQTLILEHDYHFKHLPEWDVRQSEDACSIMSLLGASLITESTLPETDSLLGMHMLAQSCLKQGLGVASAEFRSAYRKYNYIIVDALTCCKTFDEIIEKLKALETANVVGKLLLLSASENTKQFFDVLVPYVRSIPSLKEDLKINALYVEQFHVLRIKGSADFNSVNKWVYEDFIKDEKSFEHLTNKLVDGLVIKKDNGRANLNTESIHHALERASDTLFDASLLKELHKKRNERVVFIHAGSRHLTVLAKCLSEIGYQMKSFISHDSKLQEIIKTKIKDSQTFKDLLKSDEFAQCAVDVKSFLNQCKTFPKIEQRSALSSI